VNYENCCVNEKVVTRNSRVVILGSQIFQWCYVSCFAPSHPSM